MEFFVCLGAVVAIYCLFKLGAMAVNLILGLAFGILALIYLAIRFAFPFVLIAGVIYFLAF